MRRDEPRVSVRLSAVDHAMLEAAAQTAGVSLGSLLREGGLRYARELAGEVAQAPKMRRRPAPKQHPVHCDCPSCVGPLHGSTAAREALKDVATRAGVKTAKEIMLERQARLNKGRG